MDRLERLVNLVVALLDTRRPLSREELRRRVGGYSDDPVNFHRAFERDKDLLRQMGIPVLAEPLERGSEEAQTGYWVPRELYEMPDPGLDEEELMALSLAVSLVALEGAVGEEGAALAALRKLAGAPGRASQEGGPTAGALRPAGKPGEAVVDLPLGPELAVLFAGVAERRSVSFGYHGTVRHVDPYHLYYREGRWYLGGFDYSRGEERLFRVDRLQGPVKLGQEAGAFERPASGPSGPPPPWRLGNDPPLKVEVRVDASQAPWVRQVAGDQAVVGEGADGQTYFSLEVTNKEGFRSFLLGLLDHAEVVSPPEVREEVVSWLAAVAEGDGG